MKLAKWILVLALFTVTANAVTINNYYGGSAGDFNSTGTFTADIVNANALTVNDVNFADTDANATSAKATADALEAYRTGTNEANDINCNDIDANTLAMGNSLTLTPVSDMNIQEAIDYVQTQNSSSNNPWSIELASGTYNGPITIDVNDLWLGCKNGVAIITSNTDNVPTITQPFVSHLYGIRIEQEASGENAHGLRITCPNSIGSTYEHCDFNNDYYDDGAQFPCAVWADYNEAGVWNYCSGVTGSWHIAGDTGVLAGVYNYCYIWNNLDNHALGYGDYGWGQDYGNDSPANSYVAARFFRCGGNNYCIGGCGTSGLPVTADARIIECDFNDNCVAVSKLCSATILRSSFGKHCAGGSPVSFNGSFSGYAEDCVFRGSVTDNNSLGMGNADSSQDGATIINCKIGTLAELKAGTRPNKQSLVTATATIKDCMPYTPTYFLTNITIRPFDNGHSFFRPATGTTVGRNVTLPPAKIGLRYTIGDLNDVSDVVVIICNSPTTEQFQDMNGVFSGVNHNLQGGAPNYLFGLVSIECFKTGVWTITKQIGLWTFDEII